MEPALRWAKHFDISNTSSAVLQTSFGENEESLWWQGYGGEIPNRVTLPTSSEGRNVARVGARYLTFNGSRLPGWDTPIGVHKDGGMYTIIQKFKKIGRYVAPPWLARVSGVRARSYLAKCHTLMYVTRCKAHSGQIGVCVRVAIGNTESSAFTVIKVIWHDLIRAASMLSMLSRGSIFAF